MYAIVADIERYPQFLPWCAAVRIEKREKSEDAELVTAEMTVAYHGLNERYVSQVRLDKSAFMIEARHVKGPFKKLDTRWRFRPLKQGSEIHFLIEFAFRNPLLSAVAGVAFGRVASRMAQAFIERADKIYGTRTESV
jgi:coenzyme Q-binding protein COQ10